MAVVKSIALTDLLVDTENPRLEDILSNQRDTLCAIVASQGRKLLSLAQDIIENGLNPTESLLVMPSDGNYYVVLEGNRRIAALKVLTNPSIIQGVVSPTLYNAFKKLGEEHGKDIIDVIRCVIVDSRDEADHWIELKHTGENNGAGIVNWGASEKERFQKRRGKKSPPLQILDFLEQRGVISPDTKRKVGITNLTRLIKTPYVREKIGIDIQNGDVVTYFPESEVTRGLKRIVDDLASKKIKVPDIYHAEDRKNYIDSISDDLPNPSNKLPRQYPLGQTPKSIPKPKAPTSETSGTVRSKPSRKKRNTLIPARGFSLKIDQPRINEIYHELRNLPISEFSNAVAVLFRVFLELSTDEYIARQGLGVADMAKLSHKMLEVAKHLETNNFMTAQQVKPVRRAAQRDSFLGATVTTMHQYVHNQYFFPSPGDLLATWDSLEPFFVAIWDSIK